MKMRTMPLMNVRFRDDPAEPNACYTGTAASANTRMAADLPICRHPSLAPCRRMRRPHFAGACFSS